MAVTTTQLWNLTKEFIHDSGLVRQHIDSYNEFVERGLQAIVDEVGDLPIEIGDYPLKIKLGKIEIGAPRVIEVDGTERSIYPAEARIRNLTYAAPLHMEMIPVIGEREGQPEMVYIGDLPVMLKSRICLLSKLSPDDLVGVGEDPLDPGGYFIVNGSERVIVALEDLAANRILVDVEHTGVNPTYKAKIFSTTVGFRARIEVALKSDGGTYVAMPGIPSNIPLMILTRALGFEEDAKIAEFVSTDPDIQDELEASYEKSLEANNVHDAFFFFQAEDGIRDYKVTGVQTCALPILALHAVLGLLVDGEYETLAMMTQGKRLSATELRDAVESYGRTLIHPPEGEFPPDRSEERRVGKECRSRWSPYH